MVWSKELQDSWKEIHNTKKQQKECIVCGAPITKEDYNEYKKCSWCYSQTILDPEDS